MYAMEKLDGRHLGLDYFSVMNMSFQDLLAYCEILSERREEDERRYESARGK